MIYLKSVLIGFGAVLLGCLVAPIGMMIWPALHHSVEPVVSYSPRGLVNHLTGSFGFWIFLIVMFTTGFVPSVFFSKR